jgi:transposase
MWQSDGMRAIPVPLRKRIVELYEQGKRTREIAQFSGFCVAAVRRVRQLFRQRGTLDPRTHLCGRKTLLTEERKQRLGKLLSAQPDATLAELGARMDRSFRTSTIDLWLRRLGWKLKKTLAAAERDRPEVAARRAGWHKQLAAEAVAALVFVDESGASTKMTRLRGRALGGQRLLARIPHGHYQTSTLISGVRLGGPCAPWLFDGAMNGEMFLAWVRQGLARTLHPGDVVILDNLSTHKIRDVREALEAAGARLLYLPPYSPDFNPIEPMWSKIKQVLRSHAPRSEKELLQAAQTAFNAISTADCKGFFFSAQYATS